MGVLASVNAAVAASEGACAFTRYEIKSKTGKRQRRRSVPEAKVKNRLVYKHQIPVFDWRLDHGGRYEGVCSHFGSGNVFNRHSSSSTSLRGTSLTNTTAPILPSIRTFP